MRRSYAVVVACSLLLGSCCVAGCRRIPDEVKNLVSYIEHNAEGDVRCNIVTVVDNVSQKRIFIDFVNVDTIDEADEIIILSNKYYDEHRDDSTLNDCHVELRMSTIAENHSRNFICSNSDGLVSVSNDEDIVIDTDDHFSALFISPTTMNIALSDLRGHFDEIEYLYIGDIRWDDLDVFFDMDSLEKIVVGYDAKGEEKNDLSELYPDIEVVIEDSGNET